MRVASGVALLALTAFAPAVAAAGSTTLGSLPGQTAFESATGDAVQTICGALAAAGRGVGGPPGTAPTPTDDLADRCTDAVNTASALAGLGGPNQLNISSVGEANDAVASLSSSQAPAQGIQSLDTAQQRFHTFQARLFSVRAGSTGLVMQGFDTERVFAQQRAPASEEDRWQDALWEDAAAGSMDDGAAPGRLGVFVHGVVNYGDFDGTDSEAKYDFNIYGLTGGVDWRFSDIFVGGIAFNWREERTRYAGNLNVSSLGKLGRQSLGGAVYGSLFKEGFYADVIGAFTRHNFDFDRRIVYGSGAFAVDRTAKSEPQADEWSWALGTGWDFDVPGAGGLTLGPLTRVEWVRLEVDRFAEVGAGGLNLAYDRQTVESFSTVLGGRLTYALSTPFLVLVPQIRAEWQHEFQNDSRSVDVNFTADPARTRFSVPTGSPDRDWANIGASLSATLPFGLVGYTDYEVIIDRDDLTSHRFTFGFRAAFF